LTSATAALTAGLSQLREAEALIRTAGERFADVAGRQLIRIRDEGLYRHDGFDSWDAYLSQRVKERFGIGYAQAFNLISCAQIAPKLPALSSSVLEENGWSQRALLEFGRLAPRSEEHEQRYDFDRLDRGRVAAVALRVVQYCEQEGKEPTAPVVRRFVNEALGANGSAPPPAPKGGAERPELRQYLLGLNAKLQEELGKLETLPPAAWWDVRDNDPGALRKLHETCAELAELVEEALG
jgi:hypothetical protein